MKKLLLIFLLLSSTICNAQFWTESFGTGCNSGTLANGFSSTNGTWTVTTTGTNDTYADIWFVSSKCNNTGVGNCATGCSNSNNATLHIGNAAVPIASIPADSAATYLTGVGCAAPFNICSTTHKRVESPIIDCTGQSAITIMFMYIEGGEASDDDATLWYYDGNAWAQIDALAKTTVCASTSGIWTGFTTNLPASADNNSNVQIGFQWTNDNDAQGTDPSFAVDDIFLGGIVSALDNETILKGCNAYCDGSNIVIESRSAYRVLSVINMLGENVPFSLSGNSVKLKENTEGIYFLRIEVGKEVVTRKVQILR
jgi:hypothetical protein